MQIKTRDDWDHMLGRFYASQPYFLIDFETTGLSPWHGDRVIGPAIGCIDEKGKCHSFYAPFRHVAGKEQNLPIRWFYDLAPALADPNRYWNNQNTKFDVHFAEAEGMKVLCQQMDLILIAHLNNENEYAWGLDRLTKRYLGQEGGKSDQFLTAYAMEHYGIQERSALKWAKSHMAMIDPEAMTRYAVRDVELVHETYNAILPQLQKQGLDGMLGDICRYGQVGQRMEAWGVQVDPLRCQEQLEMARAKREEAAQHMFEIVGFEFNPGSHQQLKKVMGLPPGSSTDKEHLPEIDHPLVPYIELWRKWDYAAERYLAKFLRMMDQFHRLHPDLCLYGTISSRLSCRNPPLQALPRKTEIYDVRSVITAPRGYTLVSADYSQIELRFMAYYTQDPAFLEAYQGGADLHTQTALATGLDRDQAPGAKTLNFASVYGIGVDGIARKFKRSEEEAAKLHAAFHRKYPGVRRLYNQCQQMAKKKKYLPMWTGRRRHFGWGQEEHKAMSNLIQGGVAELMRVTILRLADLFEGSRCRMILQIHDDIWFEIPDEEVSFWLPLIKHVMEDYEFSKDGDPATRVPIVTEIKFGPNGGNLQKWKGEPLPEPEIPEEEWLDWLDGEPTELVQQFDEPEEWFDGEAAALEIGGGPEWENAILEAEILRVLLAPEEPKCVALSM